MVSTIRDTYLSIDLDYWETVTPTMLQFLRKVFQLNVPVLLCKSHEQMLRNVNGSNARVLINVDYHADLCEDDAGGKPPTVECGTWINAVKWRKSGSFIWVCPNKKKCYEIGAGRCDSSRDPETDPFKNRNNGWRKARVRTGLKHVDLSRVKAVGIAVSPEYLEWNTETSLNRLLERRNNYFLRLTSVLPKLPFRWLEKLGDYEPVMHLCS